MLFCFFFSSRRRHTRYWRDWSSDVCSSDLAELEKLTPEWVASWTELSLPCDGLNPVFLVGFPRSGTTLLDTMLLGHPDVAVRSEERRVGKECRSRWSPYH